VGRGKEEEVKNVSKQPIDEWIERHEKEPDIVAKEKAERFLRIIELKTLIEFLWLV
jgi:hypothetical protein